MIAVSTKIPFWPLLVKTHLFELNLKLSYQHVYDRSSQQISTLVSNPDIGFFCVLFGVEHVDSDHKDLVSDMLYIYLQRQYGITAESTVGVSV